MARTKAVACAIVKDEPRLLETIASVRAAFGDALAGLVIHDTGTTDAKALEALDALDREQGSAIGTRPFDDFASARNACLNDAEDVAHGLGAEWLHMFSGGAKYSGSWSPPQAWDSTAKALRHTEILGEHSYQKFCTVRVGSQLRFRGRTHEAIDTSELHDPPSCGLIVDYSGDWDIAKKKRRWAQDIDLLKDDFSPRGRYYLAQSFDCLGIRHEAFAYYMQRVEMRGFEAEFLQAVCNAVKCAPTNQLALFALQQGIDCADVHLAYAERCLRERNLADAIMAAGVASRRQKRSMFAHKDLAGRCAAIVAMGEANE